MKKFLFLLLTCLSFIACDNDDSSTPLAINVDNDTFSVPVNDITEITLSLDEKDYIGDFKVRYELLKGEGTFSGEAVQILGKGVYKMQFTPTKEGTNMYRLSVEDANGQVEQITINVFTYNSSAPMRGGSYQYYVDFANYTVNMEYPAQVKKGTEYAYFWEKIRNGEPSGKPIWETLEIVSGEATLTYNEDNFSVSGAFIGFIPTKTGELTMRLKTFYRGVKCGSIVFTMTVED